MTKRFLWAAAVALAAMCAASAAKADAPLIYCSGTESGGDGPRRYAYDVDAASFPMMEFSVGTNDLKPEHYLDVLIPRGWQFAVEEAGIGHIHGVKTPHGKISSGPCRCLTRGSARWWTDDPASAVEFFTFGYDHHWRSEDVSWRLETRREGPPPTVYTFREFWDSAVGAGMGPVHGPYAAGRCLGDVDGDGLVDDNDLSLVLANWTRDVGWDDGNVNSDHVVDDNDLSLVLANWTGPAAAGIPEPASALILLLGACVAGRQRR